MDIPNGAAGLFPVIINSNSVGGNLAAMLASTEGQPEFEDLSTGISDYSSNLQAVATRYGVFHLINTEEHKKQLVRVGETFKYEDDGVTERLMACKLKGNEDKFIQQHLRFLMLIRMCLLC